MKRYLLSIILGFLAMTNFSYGQLEINFASETANTNGTVDIDVTTNGFTNISVLQFSAGWDSLVMNFNSVTFTNPALPDLSEANISGPIGASGVDPGQFSFSYNNPNGNGNLDDGEVLFTVRFDIAGEECDETIIELTGDPAPIEAYDNNFDELTVSSQSGDVMINGTDCGGNNGTEITFTAGMVTVDQGSNVCVPITVMNFNDIQFGSGTILWDPSVITYTGIANAALVGFATITLNEQSTASGELKFLWENIDPGDPLSIPDGEVIFDVCFDAVGSANDMSAITLSTQGDLGFEWGTDDVDVLPQILNDGKVTITEVVEDPVTFIVEDITINEDVTTVCVDITVENFNNILGAQYVVTWDESILINAMPDNFNLPGLTAGSFNIDGNCATLSWNGVEGVNVADGTRIYSMCFDVIGDCDDTGIVDIVEKGSTEIEILDGNTDIVPNVSIQSGSVFIMCDVIGNECEILSIDKTCIGEAGGNVIVDVGTTNCTYSWANSSGVEVSTDKNLLGVVAGTYILTVTCNGVEDCVLSATVENFAELDIDGNVTNAACGDLGAINVTVGFGSGNYSYNWNPAQNDSPNISDLEPGPYQLTVTDDDNNCTKTAEFNVVNEVEDLVIASSNITDETCIEEDGSISLTIDGGCEPYEFEWSDVGIGNTPNATNLIAGNYSVTVSDDSSPANTVMASFTVDGFVPLEQDGVASITPSSGSNGSITIMITGGTPNYNYNWSGPTTGLPNSNSITGLMSGDYMVTVTDANNCELVLGPFNVPEIIDIERPSITGVMADNDANGFSVLCNGDTNGNIIGSVNGGNTPMTLTLSGDASRTITLNDLGSFVIDNLAAGIYNIEVSNIEGDTLVENIEIVEPDALETAIESGCDSEEQCDGFIDLNVSGGFGDLTYDWGVAELSGGSLNDLCQDSYAVLIKDENGCLISESVTIESCEGPVDPDCYEVRDVITPNGDGMNDQFIVTCISEYPASLEIYDRWGKLVFNQDVYDGTWMGISNSNEELIEGGYMYIINIDFGQGRREIMKGTVTLLRD